MWLSYLKTPFNIHFSSVFLEIITQTSLNQSHFFVRRLNTKAIKLKNIELLFVVFRSRAEAIIDRSLFSRPLFSETNDILNSEKDIMKSES